MIQALSDGGNAAGLVYFIFDLLHLDGEDVAALPLIKRKARLAALLAGAGPPLHYSDYHRGRGPALSRQACKLGLGSQPKSDRFIALRSKVSGFREVGRFPQNRP